MKPFFIGNIEIKTPIIQGGMGVGISLSGLASAVANEGGIGVISCAGLGLLYPKGKGDYTEKCICGLKEEIRKARQKTKGIIGVNIMVALSNYAEMVRTAISEKIDVVFAGAGLPLDLPLYLTPESKTKLVPIVSSSRAAKIICGNYRNIFSFLIAHCNCYNFGYQGLQSVFLILYLFFLKAQMSSGFRAFYYYGIG